MWLSNHLDCLGVKTDLCCIPASDIQVQRVDDERAARTIMTKQRKGKDLSEAEESYLDKLPESSQKQASLAFPSSARIASFS